MKTRIKNIEIILLAEEEKSKIINAQPTLQLPNVARFPNYVGAVTIKQNTKLPEQNMKKKIKNFFLAILMMPSCSRYAN